MSHFSGRSYHQTEPSASGRKGLVTAEITMRDTETKVWRRLGRTEARTYRNLSR